MPGEPIANSNKPFLSIVAGNIVQKVDKDTPGARYREYEKNDGSTAGKWENVYMNWHGTIQGITFKDTDFGTVCNIDLGDATLTLNTSSRYFSDFACKIPGADLKEELTFHPYDMEIEDGKKRQGISLQQNGQKLQNVYYDPESKTTIGGFPQIDEAKKEKLKKNYWKTYFAEVEAFLVEKLQQMPITQMEAPKPVNAEPVDSANIPDLEEETTEVTLETGEKIKVQVQPINRDKKLNDPAEDLPF